VIIATAAAAMDTAVRHSRQRRPDPRYEGRTGAATAAVMV
jgi:hypothetical protein